MNNITTITTTLGEFLAAHLPADSTVQKIAHGKLVFDQPSETKYYGSITLPPGPWEILDFASKLTEEQWRGIAAPLWNGYYDYTLINEPVGNYKRLVKDTATESGHSLLKSHGIHLVNPLGAKPKPFSYVKWEVQARSEQEWQSAQEKVYDPLILKAR